MLERMPYEENFLEYAEREPGILVVYGAGTLAKRISSFIPGIRYYCDINAGNNREFEEKPVLFPEELEKIEGPLKVLVCVNERPAIYENICEVLGQYDICGKVCNVFNNIAFHMFREHAYGYCYEENKTEERSLRVRLVLHDPGWICEKFAVRMHENLQKMGVDSDIADRRDPDADINHHIPYHYFRDPLPCNDTFMITHVDCLQKLDLIRYQTVNSPMGVCMSEDTMNILVQNGVPRQKVCYINPAHDGVITPKKTVLGITHRCYAGDCRKRAEVILDIAERLRSDYFVFRIMGTGWGGIVRELNRMGFETDYSPEFDYDRYVELIRSLDYYLYYGNDEGSMGYLDALAAGVKTIVTPQGYHLDAVGGLTHACRTAREFTDVLLAVQGEREKLVRSVADWTWELYTAKHLDIWNYITGRVPFRELYKQQHLYRDGIYSVLPRTIHK